MARKPLLESRIGIGLHSDIVPPVELIERQKLGEVLIWSKGPSGGLLGVIIEQAHLRQRGTAVGNLQMDTFAGDIIVQLGMQVRGINPWLGEPVGAF
jgi:hypothetical protein